MGLRLTHCQSSKCKFWWEDNCTRSLEGEYTRVDVDGKCMDYIEGESDYYKEDKGAELEIDCIHNWTDATTIEYEAERARLLDRLKNRSF